MLLPPGAWRIQEIDIPGRPVQAEGSLERSRYVSASSPPVMDPGIVPARSLALGSRAGILRKHRHPEDKATQSCCRSVEEEVTDYSIAPEARASGR